MKKVLEIAYHRNGVSGEGFHIVRFSSEDDVFIGVVFPKEHHVAVFNEGLLGQGVIKFGQNPIAWSYELIDRINVLEEAECA